MRLQQRAKVGEDWGGRQRCREPGEQRKVRENERGRDGYKEREIARDIEKQRGKETDLLETEMRTEGQRYAETEK